MLNFDFFFLLSSIPPSLFHSPFLLSIFFPSYISSFSLTYFVGLEIHVTMQGSYFGQMFSCALLPEAQRFSLEGWKVLVNDNRKAENIRCHEFHKGEQLSLLLETFKKNCSKAVILINTSNDYKLPYEFTSGVEFCLPVIVVSKSDGNRILKFLKYDKTYETVFAKINITCKKSEFVSCRSVNVM